MKIIKTIISGIALFFAGLISLYVYEYFRTYKPRHVMGIINRKVGK